MVDNRRKTAGAKIVTLPFFDPPRKRALIEPSASLREPKSAK
jgi:hypothetical protein